MANIELQQAFTRDKLKEAFDFFDIVLTKTPDNARALDCAAHCCLSIGETDRGIALAKEALKRGAMQTYQEWKEGKYKKG